jgi:acyl carrier protein
MGRRHRRAPAGTGGEPSLDERVRTVIAASFDLDEDDLPAPADQRTVPGWTSRSQMMLVLNLEERFDVSFTLEQMVTMTSAESIAAVLRRLLGSDPCR